MLGEKLKQLRLNNGLKQKDLSEFLNINRVTYTNYENGKREPDNDTIKKLAEYFNVTTDYLLGRDKPLLEITEVPRQRKIPIIGTVRCGPNGLAFEDIDGDIFVSEEIAGDIFALMCKGDSMNGLGIFPGDVAIVRKQQDIECGELAVVIVNGYEGTLKRVRKKENMIILESANVEFEPRIFVGREMLNIRIIGKVVQVIKRF